MGKHNQGCLGFVSNSRGSKAGFSIVSTSAFSSCSFQTYNRHCQVFSSLRRSSNFTEQEGDRGHYSSPSDSRVLFPSLLGSQEDRRNETCDRSVNFEQVPFNFPFQDGNQQIYQSFHSPWYVDYQSRPYGCLFPYSYFPFFQEIPPFCLGQQSLPISCASFWSSNSSSGFHQDFPLCYSSSTFQSHSGPFLPGRLPFQRLQSFSSFGPYSLGYQNFVGPRFPNFMEKVGPSYFSRFPVPRGTFQDRPGLSFPSRGEVSLFSSENSIFSGKSCCDSQTVLSTSGFSQFSVRCGTSGSSFYSASTVLSTGTLGTSLSTLGCSRSHSSFSVFPSFVVDSQRECSSRSSTVFSSANSNSLYRCVSPRLGCVPRREIHIRSLASCTSARPHQHLGNEGSSASSSVFQVSSSSFLSSVSHRQHYCSSLLEESGRHSLPIYVSSLQRNSSSLPVLSDSSGYSSYSGNVQCSSGCSVSISHSGQYGMGTSSDSFQGNNLNLGSSSFRPVCHKSKSQTRDFRFSNSRSVSICGRCNVSVMEGNVCLCIPPIQVSLESSSKDSSRRLQDHTYCTSLAKSSLVSRSSSTVLCKTSSSSSKKGSSISVQRKSCTSQSRELASSRMVTLRQGLRQRGFSAGAASHISGSVRRSTEIVYDAKWTIYCDWCNQQEIDPVSISAQQLADFLVFLFEEKHLAPSTIKGYRSAISRTISILGGPDFGNNELISLLVRNFTLERPKQNRLVPAWDLGLVLSFLKSDPFEPAESVDLKFLAYKCCFLLALASGRRRSEIHAFSVSDFCLRFSRNYSSVTILTDPSFLGKNQLPDKGADPIFIPALPEDTSKLLCPVRALKLYLDRTRSLRTKGNFRLFLPVKKGIEDISAKTISSWLCRTIRLAYESSGAEFLANHSVKAHEVRALASSWALFNSASLSEILSAGFWRCQDFFTSFYLRSMSSQADSLYSLGPIVAAQQVNFPPSSSNSGDSAIC